MRPRRRLVAFVHRLRIADELVERDRADHAAAFHQVVILRARERIRARRCVDELDAARRTTSASAVRSALALKPAPVADVAGARAAVAEVHGDAVVGVAGDREQRAADRAAAIAQLDDVADDLSVLAALQRRRARRLERRGRRRADERGVVPGQLGERLRQLLQPAVVGEAAVEDGRVGAEDDLERRRRPAAAAAGVAARAPRLSASTVFGANAVSGDRRRRAASAATTVSKSASPAACRCQ